MARDAPGGVRIGSRPVPPQGSGIVRSSRTVPRSGTHWFRTARKTSSARDERAEGTVAATAEVRIELEEHRRG